MRHGSHCQEGPGQDNCSITFALSCRYTQSTKYTFKVLSQLNILYRFIRFIRFQGLLGCQIFFSLWYLNRKISVVSLEIIKKSLTYIHNNDVNKFDKLNEIILVTIDK